MNFEEPENPLGLTDILHPTPHPSANRLIAGFAEKLLRLKDLEKIYTACSASRGPYQFVHAVLSHLNIRYQVHRENVASGCRAGPAIVVANHPFGGVDAIVMACILLGMRSDVKILANRLLLRIPQIRDLIIGVDAFGGMESKKSNIAPLREACDWLKGGGMLMLFPAGEVSHFTLATRKVEDSEWNPVLAWLLETTGARVIPAYFHGRNSCLFQGLGLLHPTLRSALLPHELINKQNRTIQVALGQSIPPEVLRAFGDRAKVLQYLRLRSFSLKALCSPDGDTGKTITARNNWRMPVVDAPDTRLLNDEVDKLPRDSCLVEHDSMAVYCFKASQAPWLLQEIGRLRELTFRASGEGTGMASDIDLYDAYYRHLAIWNHATKEVVGAYRLGLTDEVLRRSGKRRLYTQTLFKYRRPLLNVLNPGIELGRSFIRAEYRRDYAPLLLLWKAIGHFVAAHPRYRRLFGPVSISNEYQTVSQQLLVDFLRLNRFDNELARYVKPRRPFKYRNAVSWYGGNPDQRGDLGAVSNLIAEIESDHKGVPILVKHYLKLGGKFLGFNVDGRFSNVLDGLILVDLVRTDIRLLGKYMGPENARAFIAYHEGARFECPRVS
ncbi:MAG: lysophospholipid acyltransferase family protein [Gammaproteobacteria bacterium]